MKICVSCKRHVRENACPFCGDAAPGHVVPKASIHYNITRAALILGTAAGAASLGAACGGEVKDPADANTVDSSDASSDATNDVVPPDAGAPDVGIAPPYGAPLYGAAPAE